MNEVDIIINALSNKEKLVAMLAPSFPIVFDYPKIITMLKKLGFSYVVEVSVGAEKTNEELLDLLKKDPNARYITSPCPTIVRMVKNKMPQYTKYFTHGVDSPMVAIAKIVKEKYPGYRPVFIGPCIMKKLEAKEDAPELNILVLTYTEISKVFEHFNTEEEENPEDCFDISTQGPTRLYALDGGLSHSSGLSDQMKEGEIEIVSGVENNIKAIKNFDSSTKVRLLDILNCPGGCIGGPGIDSNLTLEERKQRIFEYIQKAKISSIKD